mmetsp:Transcript_12594/g.24092  ORF Transcript_12594/g.24092 Transcript_12594/m.24092 type:complete len:117 (-) Transcript_12594:179-529(-)
MSKSEKKMPMRSEKKIANNKFNKKKSSTFEKNRAHKSVLTRKTSSPTYTKALGAGVDALVRSIVEQKMELWEAKMISRIEEIVEERLSSLMYPPESPPRLIPESNTSNEPVASYIT